VGKLAFVFPGQGSQYVGMGKDLYDKFEAAGEVFRTADERLGFPLSELCFNGPEDKLTLTANQQPAILAVSVAAWKMLDAEGISPDFVAGHSLGEYSAVVAAGGLSVEDAVCAVRRRGELMQEAVPVGIGGMAALLGLDLETVATVCAEAAAGSVVELANINCPGQIVIAGHSDAVERAVEIALHKGAKKAVKLPVSAPFHSSLMIPAQEGMRGVLEKMEFRGLTATLINNADVAELQAGLEVKQGLLKQIVAPVRWEESVRKMIDLGVDTVVEIGPGKVLSGLIRRIDRELECLNVEDEESLNTTISNLWS
jgi:[acyl-carrier-protein] S-malonyltransferase